jgi:hypothetical protein
VLIHVTRPPRPEEFSRPPRKFTFWGRAAHRLLGLRFLVVALVVLTRRGHAGRVKRGRAVHRCRRSGCRSRRCAGLSIVVVAVPAAAADAMLVAHQVHLATIERNPKA